MKVIARVLNGSTMTNSAKNILERVGDEYYAKGELISDDGYMCIEDDNENIWMVDGTAIWHNMTDIIDANLMLKEQDVTIES